MQFNDIKQHESNSNLNVVANPEAEHEPDLNLNMNMNTNENLCMYLLVNNSLGMSKGKIASQVAHAVGQITEDILTRQFNGINKVLDSYKRYVDWKNSAHTKIILKVNQEELLNFIDAEESVCVYDCGRTQIAPNSLTVIGFYPNVKSKKFNNFKLL